MEKTRMVHRSIMAAFCTLLATTSAKAAVVTLHPLPALSTVPSRATGIADVDSVQGVVTLEVHDLPPLPAGAVYAGLLVHNTPGPGHSIALDPGPDGDEMLDLGSLAQSSDIPVTIHVDPARLACFPLDMVVVVRKIPGTADEIVIGGLVSIVDKHGGRPVPDLELEGASVFSQETFDGNGRTCGTCHPAANNFTLSPAFIAALPAHDPLFVAEFVPELAGLENPALMHGPRALILENIDGFDQPPVFRGAPHILNAALTAPFGLSGNVPTLGEFALGAIVQHAPKRLDRVAGIDFRLPTQEEIDAVEAFQRSVFAPPDMNFELNTFLTTDQQRRGRDLFFGRAKCFFCHNSPVLAGPGAFNTGVVNAPINQTPPPECPSCGPLGLREANGTREFNVPPLVGIAHTAPFFHDNSAATLRDAVAFYDSPAFQSSPASRLVGRIEITPAQIDDITAFLSALTMCGNGVVDDGEECDDGNAASGDSCRPDCTVERCGDGIVDPGEACDDGAANGSGRCCAGTCQPVDADGVCPRDGACRFTAGPTGMAEVRSLVVDYKRTGPGGGDDVVRNVGAAVDLTRPFNPKMGDDVLVTLEIMGTTGTPQPVLSETLAHERWFRRKTGREKWVYHPQPNDAVQKATLRKMRSGQYAFRMAPVVSTLIDERLSATDAAKRLVVEIGRSDMGDCVCAEREFARCVRVTSRLDRCDP